MYKNGAGLPYHFNIGYPNKAGTCWWVPRNPRCPTVSRDLRHFLMGQALNIGYTLRCTETWRSLANLVSMEVAGKSTRCFSITLISWHKSSLNIMFPTAMGDVSHHFWTKNGTFRRGSLEKLLLATSFRISTWGKVEKCSQSPVVQRFFGIFGIGMMGNYFRYKRSCIDHV